MTAFLLSRFLRMGVTLWLVVTAVFLATRLTGNPIDYLMPEGLDAEGRSAMIAYWGLDRDPLEQYALFWRSLFEGEFGLGLMERRPVTTIFGERMLRSLALLALTLGATIAIGVPVGVLTAVWRERRLGSWVLFMAFLGYAIPNFILAILLLLLFSHCIGCPAPAPPRRCITLCQRPLWPPISSPPSSATPATPCWTCWARTICAPPMPRACRRCGC